MQDNMAKANKLPKCMRLILAYLMLSVTTTAFIVMVANNVHIF